MLVVGGSVGYTGAPYLTAAAAEHSGCGMVWLGVPQSIWQIEAIRCVGIMPFPLPDEDGMLSSEALALREKLGGCDVLALGPGLGRSAGVRETVLALLREADQPVVLDADGLNALAEDMAALEARRGRVTVLTPHEGEFARLMGIPLETLLSRSRVETSQEFAQHYGCILVRKGHRTLVALPDGQVLENPTGGSALAKGGSGDVLTGAIASLIAQGAEAAYAAVCAVWLHGRAGDLLAGRMSSYCVTPEDLAVRGLVLAFQEFM